MCETWSSSFWMRASLSFDCCESSSRSWLIWRRASSSSKRPACALAEATSAKAAAAAIRSAFASPMSLTRVLDVRTAVLGPGGLVVALRDGLLLAEADGLDAVVRHAQHGHDLLHRLGAALAEREVVYAAAALVAIALDLGAGIAVLDHVARVRLHERPEFVLHHVRVEVEVDAALRKDVVRVVQGIALDVGRLVGRG